MKFVCTVCGYTEEGDHAPEKCPICSASSDKFKQGLLEKYSDVLSDLYIVSHTNIKASNEPLNEYSQDDYTVKVFKASGQKCSRCWKYRELNQDGICEDCKNAI